MEPLDLGLEWSAHDPPWIHYGLEEFTKELAQSSAMSRCPCREKHAWLLNDFATECTKIGSIKHFLIANVSLLNFEPMDMGDPVIVIASIVENSGRPISKVIELAKNKTELMKAQNRVCRGMATRSDARFFELAQLLSGAPLQPKFSVCPSGSHTEHRLITHTLRSFSKVYGNTPGCAVLDIEFRKGIWTKLTRGRPTT